jgi:hypothetical protein
VVLFASFLLPGQSRPVLDDRYGKLPLSFEENRGQTDARVRFLAHGEGYSLFLTDSEAVLALRSDVVRMQLAGAKGRAFVSGMEELPGKANYFIGNEPAKWRSNVPTYGKVSYKDVYPGVDLIYYGNQRQLEYDFVIAPGADPRQVKLRFAGAMAVKINASGDLTVSTKHGEIAFQRPVVYQWKDGKREGVEGRFRLLGRSAVGLSVGKYDRGRQLVVDPTLAYSTYLGGSGGASGDSANAVAVDAAGNAYVTGQAGSLDFPVTAGAFQTVNKTAVQAPNGYLSKLNATGTALVYSTYFGGSGCCELGYGDAGNGVAIDAEGNAYVAGATYSSDFPVTAGSFQTTKNNVRGSNGFVTKFNATGSALVYSTFLGGSSAGIDYWQYGDGASAIAVDGAGSAYVTGVTYSTDFPVSPGAFQTVNKAAARNNGNAFVTKLNPAGTALLYSTYLGGSGNPTTAQQGYRNYGDAGQSIAIDGGGSAYVAGFAFSSDFPVTASAFQIINKGEVNHPGSNAFITKLNPLGTELVYSTFLGGGNAEGASFYDYIDAANSIALDAAGDAYVTGYAYSTDFPVTIGAFQTTNRAAGYGANAFITKLNPEGTALVYSTYLGGTGSGLETPMWANGTGIAVDAAGNAYVSGIAISADFPVTANAFQAINSNVGGPFLSELDASGANLVYSTFLSGSGGNPGRDLAFAIALDVNANAFLAGSAFSKDFPVTVGAFQTTNNAHAHGTTNAFITKFGIGSGPLLPGSTTTLAASANPQDAGLDVTFTADVTAASGGGVPTGSVAFSVDGTVVDTVALDVTGHAKYSTSALSTGPHTILATYSGDANYSGSSTSLVETIIGTVPITFGTSPAGLTYSVDGTSYTSQRTLALLVGSKHTISVSSPQTSAGVQNTFASWSDGGGESHTITARAAATYTADFSTAYLLTATVNPTTGGTVSPGSGTYYAAGTVVDLTATANSGYAFSSWTGSVANAASASTTVTMKAPQSVTASFGVSGVTYLFGNITGKSGASDARVWSIQVSNNGPAAAVGAEVSGITLTQVAGAACAPTIATGLPIAAGNLAPSANATVGATIDFASCAANARFTVNVALSANAGSSGGSIVRLNQFQ